MFLQGRAIWKRTHNSDQYFSLTLSNILKTQIQHLIAHYNRCFIWTHCPRKDASIIQPKLPVQPFTIFRISSSWIFFFSLWEEHCIWAWCQATVCKILQIQTANIGSDVQKGRNNVNLHSHVSPCYLLQHISQIWIKRDMMLLMPLYCCLLETIQEKHIFLTKEDSVVKMKKTHLLLKNSYYILLSPILNWVLM